MAEGPSTTTANNILNAICNATSYSVAEVWIQLHTAAPGAAGTTAVATETDRQQASFAAPSGGAVTTDADLVWTSVAGSEDYTHWTAWTASSAGTFLQSGTVTANAVTSGDNFTIPAGDLDLTIAVAS